MPHHLIDALNLLKSSVQHDALLDDLLSKRLSRLEGKPTTPTCQTDSAVNGGGIALKHGTGTPLTAPLFTKQSFVQQQPSNVIKRIEGLVHAISANEDGLNTLLTGGVHVGMPPCCAWEQWREAPEGGVAPVTVTSASLASHLSVVRSMRPSQIPSSPPTIRIVNTPMLPTATPQQLIDGARPGDVIILRPGMVYLDMPLKVTTPFITIRGGGRKTAHIHRGGAAIDAEFHRIVLTKASEDQSANEDELVSKSCVVLHNRLTDKSAISIHAQGVRIENLMVYQVSHEAPAVAVHLQSVSTIAASHETAASPVVTIKDCTIVSSNCHAIHVLSANRAMESEDSLIAQERSDKAVPSSVPRSNPSKAANQFSRGGELEVMKCVVRSLKGNGIQIGNVSGTAVSATNLGTSVLPEYSEKNITIIPPRIPRVLIRDVTFGYCGGSCIVLNATRCESFSIIGCSMTGGCGRYGIHLGPIPSLPPTAPRASSASIARRSPFSASGSRQARGNSVSTCTAADSASLINAVKEITALRSLQHSFDVVIRDTMIRDPGVCGVVVDGGRVVSVIERTTASLSTPNSTGLYLHPEGIIKVAENNLL